MSRRRRSGPDAEDIVRAAAGLFILLALGIGGVAHFADAARLLIKCIVIGALALFIGAIVWAVVRRKRTAAGRARDLAAYAEAPPSPPELSARRAYAVAKPTNRSGARVVERSIPAVAVAAASPAAVAAESPAAVAAESPPEPRWDARRVRQRLDEIDWYQFEKFCAALLQADGFAVERRGGAQPDGGVDLVVEKQGVRALIQCKHWRTWSVQEKVVRELLGSMTHFGVTQGAIYTLKGWTQPAADFADKHAITLVNGDELAASAALQLAPERLEELLNATAHHCPKCESPMVWREGDFTPFWGCSRFPRCRGKLKYSGAR